MRGASLSLRNQEETAGSTLGREQMMNHDATSRLSGPDLYFQCRAWKNCTRETLPSIDNGSFILLMSGIVRHI